MEKLFFPLIAIGVIVAVVFIHEGQRRILIQYAEADGGPAHDLRRLDLHAVAREHGGRHPDHLRRPRSWRLPTIGQYFLSTQGFVNDYFLPTSLPYMLFQGFLIVVFTGLHGGAVQPGRPGRQPPPATPSRPVGPPTAQYLDRVLTRLTLPGAGLPGARAADAVHPLRRLLAGHGRRARRHLRPHRGRRRARHDAAEGAAHAAFLRGLPQIVNVLLLGPQGSGKGTQAKRISAEAGIPASRPETCSRRSRCRPS